MGVFVQRHVPTRILAFLLTSGQSLRWWVYTILIQDIVNGQLFILKRLFLFAVSHVARLLAISGTSISLFCPKTCPKGESVEGLQDICLFRANRDAMDELQLKRYCCRRMVLTHVDLIEKLLHYNRASCSPVEASQGFTFVTALERSKDKNAFA